MLDYFAIFTKGGALLWAWQLGALRGDPIGALVRSCLLEDRSGEKSFAYAPPGGTGGGYTVKWSFHNVSNVSMSTWRRWLWGCDERLCQQHCEPRNASTAQPYGCEQSDRLC